MNAPVVHVTELFQRSPGNNFQIECSCGAESGVLVGKLRDAKAIQRDHEETGEPFPQGLALITFPVPPAEPSAD